MMGAHDYEDTGLVLYFDCLSREEILAKWPTAAVPVFNHAGRDHESSVD